MTEPSDVLSGKERWALVLGDCVDVLKGLPENSVDSVVCDPPYFLTSDADSSSGFMGKEWDAPASASVGYGHLNRSTRAWLAGLIAGEGCFRIHRERGGEYYACHFSLHMRAD